FYWMLITTFKTEGDLYNLRSNPYWFNAAPTLEHLRYLFEDTLFVQWLWNTALIGACVVAITLAVAVPAGYSLARTPGPRGHDLRIGIFLTYLVAPTLLFLPLSRLLSALRVSGAPWVLVVGYPGLAIPVRARLVLGVVPSRA